MIQGGRCAIWSVRFKLLASITACTLLLGWGVYGT